MRSAKSKDRVPGYMDTPVALSLSRSNSSLQCISMLPECCTAASASSRFCRRQSRTSPFVFSLQRVGQVFAHAMQARSDSPSCCSTRPSQIASKSEPGIKPAKTLDRNISKPLTVTFQAQWPDPKPLPMQAEPSRGFGMLVVGAVGYTAIRRCVSSSQHHDRPAVA